MGLVPPPLFAALARGTDCRVTRGRFGGCLNGARGLENLKKVRDNPSLVPSCTTGAEPAASALTAVAAYPTDPQRLLNLEG